MRTLIAIAASLFVLGCGAGGHTLAGSLTLTATGLDRATLTCEGTGGFNDIGSDAPVVVKDGAGVIVGTGSLKFDAEADKRANVCVFDFIVPVKDADFYELTIGHRPVTYSKADLEAKGWNLGLTLGE